MSQTEIIRAWKDPNYRSMLSAQELAALPPHPSSVVAVTDQELSGEASTGTVQFSVCICTTSIICPFIHDSGSSS
jgi:mersacidin/lichenicidin family type 2 lantibiotic